MNSTFPTGDKKKLAAGLFANNELERALGIYIELCEADDSDAQSWNMAGAISGMLGNYEDAVSYCRHAVALLPATFAAQLNLGNALLSIGDYTDARQHLEKALDLEPDNEHVCNSLGTLMLRLAQTEKAYEYYQKALRICPGFSHTHNNIGALLRETGNAADAIRHLQRALELNPEYLDAWINLGGALLDSARNSEAEQCYQRARSLYPDHPEALAGIGTLLERRGKLDEAYAVIRPLMETDSVNVHVAILFAKLSGHIARESYAIDLLKRLLAASTENGSMTVQLNFALGELLDRQGKYDEAFDCYQVANSHVNRRFSIAEHRESIDCLIDKYSNEFMANAPRASVDSSRLVFIVGMPRSGTSLVEQILSSHPDVYGLGEVDHIPRIIESLREGPGGTAQNYPACLDQISTDYIDNIATRHLNSVAQLSGNARRVVDKTMTNYLALGLIELLFPGAHIIHCTRDPVDVCLSCYFQQFSATQAYSYDLDNLGDYLLEYQRLMRHWKRVLGIPVLEVNYADLVNNPERVVRSMIEKIGIDWNPECLRYFESGRQVMTASYNQVTRPIYKKSIDRWINYRSRIGALIDKLEMAEGGNYKNNK